MADQDLLDLGPEEAPQPSASRARNISGLLKNPKSKLVIVITAMLFVLLVVVLVMKLRSGANAAQQISGASIPTPPTVATDPTNTGISPAYSSLVKDNDKAQLAEAEKSGKAAMPTPVTSETKADLAGSHRGALFDPKLVPPGGASTQVAAPVGAQGQAPVTFTPVQAPAAQPVQRQVAVRELPHVKGQIDALLRNVSEPRAQRVVIYEQQPAQQGGGFGAQAPAAPAEGAPRPADRPLIQSGTIAYGALDRAVNSDVPGPVFATIYSGPLKGQKVQGEFRKDDSGEGLVLTFSSMSPTDGGKSIPIRAYAVGLETDSYAIATAVNNRYIERWGSLLAASFLQGAAAAYSRVGGTVTTTTTGNIVTYEEPSGKQIAAQALGQVATNAAGAIGRNFNRPSTVTIRAGEAIGILFVGDVMPPGANQQGAGGGQLPAGSPVRPINAPVTPSPMDNPLTRGSMPQANANLTVQPLGQAGPQVNVGLSTFPAK